jgi:hypothetical protein
MSCSWFCFAQGPFSLQVATMMQTTRARPAVLAAQVVLFDTPVPPYPYLLTRTSAIPSAFTPQPSQRLKPCLEYDLLLVPLLPLVTSRYTGKFDAQPWSMLPCLLPSFCCHFQTTQLGNGVVVATQDNGGAASAITVAVGAGSRNETFSTAGVSHYMRNMAFQVCPHPFGATHRSLTPP